MNKQEVKMILKIIELHTITRRKEVFPQRYEEIKIITENGIEKLKKDIEDLLDESED